MCSSACSLETDGYNIHVWKSDDVLTKSGLRLRCSRGANCAGNRRFDLYDYGPLLRAHCTRPLTGRTYVLISFLRDANVAAATARPPTRPLRASTDSHFVPAHHTRL